VPPPAVVRARRLQRRTAALLAELRERVDDETWMLVLRLEETLNARTTILLDGASEERGDASARPNRARLPL